ncbi:MAG TPA: hypothetical protein PKJ71_06660 [Bacteroidales bacterium]|nr:hypothetical protein [Bacteroidales bacterium]
MNSAKPYEGDNIFRAIARRHQSEFRKKVLRVDFDSSDPRAQYGNLLPQDAAKQGLIFYEGYRDHIMKVAKKRYGKINGTARYSNLLRSEHIPLNLFAPMEQSFEKAAGLFNEILSGGIGTIEGIWIEYPYKHDPTKHLHDRTSFDTFISYTSTSGLRGGIGIEVKYTEEGYKIGKKEKDDMKDPDHPYTTVTTACGYFLDPKPETFKADHLRQIWRNHILGASMIVDGELDVFHCIHLYPQWSTHFNEFALPKYRELLTEKGKETFIGLTYEGLFHLMGKYFTTPQEIDWIDYLKRRYLF